MNRNHGIWRKNLRCLPFGNFIKETKIKEFNFGILGKFALRSKFINWLELLIIDPFAFPL